VGNIRHQLHSPNVTGALYGREGPRKVLPLWSRRPWSVDGKNASAVWKPVYSRMVEIEQENLKIDIKMHQPNRGGKSWCILANGRRTNPDPSAKTKVAV
jgi:hypothetical protein